MNTNDLPIDEHRFNQEKDNIVLYDCLKWLFIIVIAAALYHLLLYSAGYEVISKSQNTIAQSMAPSSQPADFIIGPCELQERLNQIEPDNPIRVDGIIGPQSIAKWNRVWFNQCAAKTFKVSKIQSEK